MLEIANLHGNREFGRVIGACAFGQHVGGRFEPPRLRPFLQCRLGIGAIGVQHLDLSAKEALNEFEGLAEPAVAIDGADDGFGHVGEDRFLFGAAGPRFAFPKVEIGAKAEFARNDGAGFAAHQAVEAA